MDLNKFTRDGVVADLALERRSLCLPGGSRPERRVK